MAIFTPAEVQYLQSQRLGRLATVNAKGEPHVIPVAYRFDPQAEVLEIAGRNMAGTRKYRDVRGQGKAAFVVDDWTGPSQARAVEVRGRAAIATVERDGADVEVIRITPRHIVSWGLEGGAYQRSSRRVARA